MIEFVLLPNSVFCYDHKLFLYPSQLIQLVCSVIHQMFIYSSFYSSYLSDIVFSQLPVYFVTWQEILLKGILQIVEANMNMEPLHYLTFPVILGASMPAGLSPGSRQNSTAASKSVGLLWKGKLSPGRREGDIEYRPSHLRSSPWHIAPLHLPLVGQNCWPHMASGFSASLWLRVAEQEEKDGDKDKGET